MLPFRYVPSATRAEFLWTAPCTSCDSSITAIFTVDGGTINQASDYRKERPLPASAQGSFEPGAKPFNGHEEKKVSFPCKGYQEYKRPFTKLFIF